jgi:hypothetical protein
VSRTSGTALPLARQGRHSLPVMAGHELRYAKLAPAGRLRLLRSRFLPLKIQPRQLIHRNDGNCRGFLCFTILLLLKKVKQKPFTFFSNNKIVKQEC